MSVSDAVWAGSKSSGTSRLVLLALARLASPDGMVRSGDRSLTALATMCNVSRSSVRRGLRSLVKLEEVVVLKQGTGRHEGDYWIRLSVGEDA